VNRFIAFPVLNLIAPKTAVKRKLSLRGWFVEYLWRTYAAKKCYQIHSSNS